MANFARKPFEAQSDVRTDPVLGQEQSYVANSAQILDVMNKLNTFASLPVEDRNLILDLCKKHTYDQVVEILAKPRSEGGMEIVCSASTLCRFYCNHDPVMLQALASRQGAADLYNRRAAGRDCVLGGIVALLENRLFEKLRSNEDVENLKSDFRQLAAMHRCFLAEEKRVNDLTKSEARQPYYRHLEKIHFDAPENDFIRADIPGDSASDRHEADEWLGSGSEETDVIDSMRLFFNHARKGMEFVYPDDLSKAEKEAIQRKRMVEARLAMLDAQNACTEQPVSNPSNPQETPVIAAIATIAGSDSATSPGDPNPNIEQAIPGKILHSISSP